MRCNKVTTLFPQMAPRTLAPDIKEEIHTVRTLMNRDPNLDVYGGTFLLHTGALMAHIAALEEERKETAGILREIIATDLTSDLTLIVQIRAALARWGEGAAPAAPHPG